MTESLDSSEDDAFDNKFYLRPVSSDKQKRIKTVSESVGDRTPPRYEAPWPPGAIVGMLGF